MPDPNAPVSPYVEFARAIALANLDPPGPEGFRLLVNQDPASRPVPFVAAYAPFVEELARTLREKGPSADPRAVPYPFHVYRPAYGIENDGVFRSVQEALREILSELLAGSRPAALHEHSRDITLHLDVVSLTRGPEPGETLSPRERRRLGYPITVGTSHIPARGRDAFVYGVVLAAEAKLLGRLGRCNVCRRFILGKTARVVHCCAHAQCRGAAASPISEPSTQGAAYQKRRRQRQAEWREFVRSRLDAAVEDWRIATRSGEAERAREPLRMVIAEGRVLLLRCFVRREGARRAEAERHLRLAEEALWSSEPR